MYGTPPGGVYLLNYKQMFLDRILHNIVLLQLSPCSHPTCLNLIYQV